MSKVVLVTHGKLADGILSAAQLIVGEQSDVKTFGVELGCDLEKLKKGITDLLEEYSKENEFVVIMTDIFYGTPFNIITSLMESYDFIHITGINLGIVLEVLMKKDELSNSELNQIIEQGKQGIVNCSDIISKLSKRR